MNKIINQYRKNYKQAVAQYKKNRTLENLKSVQIAGANYSQVKRTTGVK